MTTDDGGTARSRSAEWVRHLAIAALVIASGSQPIGGQTTPAGSNKADSWAVPRTADGQPDLQGVWNYATEMPLQRPDELAGKESLTAAEEAKYREQMAARRRERQSGKPTRYSGEVFDDVLAKADWSKRTSLITDPRDGKIPPSPPHVRKRDGPTARRSSRSRMGPRTPGWRTVASLAGAQGPRLFPATRATSSSCSSHAITS